MLYQTWLFGAFFLAVWPVWLIVKGTPLRSAWLLLASYLFYGWWNPLYPVLIAYATLVDYAVATLLARTGRPWARKLLLAAAVANKLALLGQFKYAAFLADSINAVLGWLGAAGDVAVSGVVWPPGFGAAADALAGLLDRLGIRHAPPTQGWMLPVGISFYTFQSLTYLVDLYRGRIPLERDFIRFAAFVSMFPQLLAGPIERAENLLPQLRGELTVGTKDLAEGASLLLAGMFKKVALADYLAVYVDRVYDAPGQAAAPALILATLAFTWQIYFDFSGYTDMARGVARLLGFRLMANFNRPYLATGLGEFWSRWHVSLSTWFRDYVYIPLGGNRRGKLNTYRNMVVTMLISGLWHGAAWTFVIWGGLHALGRVLTRELEATAFWARRVPKPVKQAIVFAFVSFAWIFFRARTLEDAWHVVGGIFTFAGGWDGLRRLLTTGRDMRALAGGLAVARLPALAAILILGVWAYQYARESRLSRVLDLAPVRAACAFGMILYLAIVPGAESQPFIYFQF